ncbi:MAG: arginine--tRNA ligase [Candidatus Lokiarchaeota archaeon]|nr:arginine--tRNA ligase [Candidatus Lokiarchaeota archaeon]
MKNFLSFVLYLNSSVLKFKKLPLLIMHILDKTTVAEYLNKYIPELEVRDLIDLIEIPPAGIDYTYAFPTYSLAKVMKKAPKVIAQELVDKFEFPEYFSEIKAVGAYVNFKVNANIVLQNIFSLNEKYGNIRDVKREEISSVEKIVIEFPSPNTNKPLHLGHVRNLLIGKTLSNLLEYKEYKVFRVNLNNDRGIHICKSMLAYKKWGNDEKPQDVKSDHFVGKYYVKYNKMESQNEDLIEEAKDLLLKWEQKEPQTRKLWKKLNGWAIQGFEKTYEKFDISFDKQYFESDFYWKGKEKILDGLKKGIFKERKDGAIIVDFEEHGIDLPNKVLLRSDGTSIYITQDIYLAYLKKKDFNYDKSIYIVGNEQNLYFKQLFAVLDLLDFKEDKYHLSYGMISLPQGKMKSREGTVVDADDLVDQMKELAYQEVDKRYCHLSDEEKRERAEIIGMGALKFFILKYNPKSDFIFYPEESISFEGETGPYVQYCYARIESIIQKSKERIDPKADITLLTHKKEQELIKQLNYFPEIVESAVNGYNIHLIAQYLLTLGQAFNTFYTSCQVISDDKAMQTARLLLIKSVQIVIKSGLSILGIKTLKEM